MKLVGCKRALNPRRFILLSVLSGGPGVNLTLYCFLVYSTRRFVLSLALCYFVLVFLSPFRLLLPRLGKRELFLVLFVRLFILHLFGFACFLFLLVSGKGCSF